MYDRNIDSNKGNGSSGTLFHLSASRLIKSSGLAATVFTNLCNCIRSVRLGSVLGFLISGSLLWNSQRGNAMPDAREAKRLSCEE